MLKVKNNKNDTIAIKNEPDFYGAIDIAAEYCNHLEPRPYAPKAWLHGWLYQPLTHIRQILHWSEKGHLNLVFTQVEKEFCVQNGFPNTIAVGAPFLYLSLKNVQRIKDSILLVPPHSTDTIEAQYDLEEYIKSIKKYITHYRHKIILTETKKLTKRIKKVLQNEKFLLHESVKINDKKAYEHIQKIFLSVETVTSPCLGSHIPYGAFCGCRISVTGSRFYFSEKIYENDPWSKQNPEVVKSWVNWENSDQPKETYPFLFCPINEAKIHKQWAETVLGLKEKKSPEKLKKIMGWNKVTNFLNKKVLKMRYSDD